VTIPVEEWRAEVLRRGGGDWMACRFQCLSCGTILTGREFEAEGGDPRHVMQECVGRLAKVKARQHVDGNTKPCNWATFGLFRLGGLVEVQMEDGAVQLVWPFAAEAA
jgi:hypothetical protein